MLVKRTLPCVLRHIVESMSVVIASIELQPCHDDSATQTDLARHTLYLAAVVVVG